MDNLLDKVNEYEKEIAELRAQLAEHKLELMYCRETIKAFRNRQKADLLP